MSHLLDVIISLAFLFFLLSTLVSAVLEFWNTRIGKNRRSVMLYDAILNAFNDKNGRNWAEALYQHPLVESMKQKFDQLPSYIDAKTFSASLVDIFVKEQTKPEIEYEDGQPKVKNVIDSKLRDAWNNELQKLKPYTKPVSESKPESGTQPENEEDAETRAKNAEPAITPAFEAFALKWSFDQIPNGDVRNLMLSFTNDTGNIEGVRKNIEHWYSGYMERVGGWYKRKLRIPLFIFSLVVAVGLNVDSLHVVQTLWQDDDMREKLVNDAIVFAENQREKEYAPDEKQPADENPSGNNAGEETSGEDGGSDETPTGSTDAGSTQPDDGTADTGATDTGTTTDDETASTDANEETPTGSAVTAAANASDKAAEQTSEEPALSKFERDSLFADSLKTEVNRIKELYSDIAAAGFPIGWDEGDKEKGFFSRMADSFMKHFFGWLITALLLMQGAPFWFDVLTKTINIRGNGAKPKPTPAEK